MPPVVPRWPWPIVCEVEPNKPLALLLYFLRYPTTEEGGECMLPKTWNTTVSITHATSKEKLIIGRWRHYVLCPIFWKSYSFMSPGMQTCIYIGKTCPIIEITVTTKISSPRNCSMLQIPTHYKTLTHICSITDVGQAIWYFTLWSGLEVTLFDDTIVFCMRQLANLAFEVGQLQASYGKHRTTNLHTIQTLQLIWSCHGHSRNQDHVRLSNRSAASA